MNYHFQHFNSLDSTNKEVLRQAEQGADAGLVITADKQTAGKGRLGRTWHNMPNALTMSVLLRPHLQAMAIPKLSLLTAVALHEALAQFSPDIGIKWPNDLLIQGKKVSGILTEMRCSQQHVKAVVLGMGVNICPPTQGWPPEIMQAATDLTTASGNTINKENVMAAILHSLDMWYTRFLKQGFAPVREAWWAAHVASGQQVRVYDGQSYIEGIAHDLAADGALCLLVNGEEKRIIAGDVSLLAKPT